MNFEWTAEQQAFRQRIAGLFDESAEQDLREWKDCELAQLKSGLSSYLARLAEVGYLDIALGPEGAPDTMTLIAVQEKLARFSGSLFLAVEVTARLFAGLLTGFGNNQEHTDILRLYRRGALIGAVAVTERESANAHGHAGTTAVKDGNGYVITGRKDFVTNGPVADWIAVAAQADEGAALFLIEHGRPGLNIGRRIRTMGLDALAVGSIELNEVRVPISRVIGPIADNRAIPFLRVTQDQILTVVALGLMQEVIEDAKQSANERTRDGRPVFKHQEIRFKFADMLTLAQTAQLLAYRAGWLYSVRDPDAESVTHCAKVFAAEAAEKVAAMGMQIAAADGYVHGHALERRYREAKYPSIAGTTNERARMAIAENLLDRYRI